MCYVIEKFVENLEVPQGIPSLSFVIHLLVVAWRCLTVLKGSFVPQWVYKPTPPFIDL